MRTKLAHAALIGIFAAAAGCDEAGTADPTTAAPVEKSSTGKADASAEAVVIDMSFSAELWTSHCFSASTAIQDQLLYTMGQLNGHKSVGRLDRMVTSNVKTATVDGRCHITYDARLPVAWGKKNAVPTTYELVLPRDVSYAGVDAFAKAYGESCVDWGAHDVDSGSMWYYFRPERSGCRISDDDVIRPVASVSVSPVNTTGKYPEYHKVWEDGVLRVVAVFGKYEDGATSGDAGIDAYNRFVSAAGSELKRYGVKSTPEVVPSSPGVGVPEVIYEAEIERGRRVEIVSLLVDNVRTAGASFDRRYEELSTHADLIVYNGHAGLGANVRALAKKGRWTAGQYVIVFLNGCDTYAYIDGSLAEAHADVNDDDPDGTKYVDTVTNAMPSFFRSMANATMAMVRGLMAYDEPRTYERIFTDIDQAEVVIVTGEHDNVYVPGYVEGGDGEPVEPGWVGLTEAGELGADEDAHFATPKLPAGRYVFRTSGSGDVDLYVRIGEQPSADLYDCRPFLTGSQEVCEVTLDAPAALHVMVNAWGAPATFALEGAALVE